MSHAWQQTIDIDEAIAKKVIEAQHHLSIQTIQLFDSGWDNVVYLVNHAFIFRFPRREISLKCMENEISLVPYIQRHVSFALSAPQYLGVPSEHYPCPFAGYLRLKGIPLSDVANGLVDDASFAVTLATWLRELHHIQVTPSHIDAVQGDHDWRYNVSHRTHRCVENLERYHAYFVQAGLHINALKDAVHQLKTWQIESRRDAFVHGDLYSRHILIDDDTRLPTGIIDWGDVHVGHPGVDLSAGMIFTPSALKIFMDTYGPVTEETRRVMLFNSFCHSMSFLPYVYEQNKAMLIQWAILVLQRAMDGIAVI